MYRVKIFTFCIILLAAITKLLTAAEYSPEITGNYESGEMVYIDVIALDDEDDLSEEGDDQEEVIDAYHYEKLWLRFKQKINKSDYYYIKVQYYKKDYQVKKIYNHDSYDLWTNYSFKINEKLDNKLMMDLRDNKYLHNRDNSYSLLRLKYQVNYQIDDSNDCSCNIQRQWKSYPHSKDKDNIYDCIKLSWDKECSDNLSINTGLQFDWTSYDIDSDKNNRKGHKLDIGFKWKL